MAIDKLYFHGSCLACRGTGKTWYNRPCPYCYQGRAYHEASDKLVQKYVLEEMDENTQKELFNEMKEKYEGEN